MNNPVLNAPPVCTDRRRAGLTDLAQRGTEGVTSRWVMRKTRTARQRSFVALMAVMPRAAPRLLLMLPR